MNKRLLCKIFHKKIFLPLRGVFLDYSWRRHLTLRRRIFWLGSHRYVVERGQDAPELARQAQALEADGKTVIVIGNRRHVCGLVAVADVIRPHW